MILRVLTACLATGAALGLALLAAPAAVADEGDTWVVSFEGHGHAVYFGLDGVTETGETEVTSETLWCGVESCEYRYFTSGDERAVLSAAAPSTTVSWPGWERNYCEGDWEPAGSATVSFSGTTLTVHLHREPSAQHDDCGYTWGSDYEFVGEWRGGDRADLCALVGGPCPGERPVAESSPVPVEQNGSGPADPGANASTVTSRLSDSPSAPSVLSALATPAQAGTAPSQLALAALVTVILLLLVAFPTALLNSASEAAADRLGAWRARRTAARTPDAVPPAWSRSWWWAAAGVAAASVISSFVDPGFGLNLGSARVLLSLATGFAVDVVLGWAAVIWLTRRLVPAATHSYAFQPLSLLLVVVAVIFTRVSGFEPGIVFGLVAGVAFAGLTGAAAKARSVLISLGWAFGLAVTAWIAYGALAGWSGESFWGTFAVETLSGIAVGGMAALPIALVPLRGLAGQAIWSWNRWVWAGCYALGLFAFFIVLMPMPFAWGDVPWSLWAWIGAYLVYAAVAVTSWLLLTRPWERRPAEAGEAADANSAETVTAPAP